ncbi:PAS domain S-box protein [Aminipila butyrica]|uniref:HTH-type transcriptional regulatory protein TyrR n=1 Tax=Aminipila butyrica TaxID=433296 RepID=A0A858BU85_9FIRM|nr:sigma 54-interacting transcriptional regulator [Aminipila butyrica]QIB68902.1 PAS domain S-box protein [Aminipila butyrica]
MDHVADTRKLDYEAILKALHDDIVVVDENGVIVQVTPGWEKNYGMTMEEAVGKTVYYMEEQKIFKPSVARIVFETGERLIIAHELKPGTFVLIVAVPLKDVEGKIKYVVSYAMDITDLQIIEEKYEKMKRDMIRYKEELNSYRRLFQTYEKQSQLQGVQHLHKIIDKMGKYDANVLITGESGVGKTTFARMIHAKSCRAEQSFIEISCGAIPENLLESELFGYEKGAFTGADQKGKIGLIEMAHKGTLFLDEVSDLPLKLQVKLLKVLQDKVIMRVGGKTEIAVDFRLITASNKDLQQLVSEEAFREDLFYRLNVVPLEIPPLRERAKDILYLINTFIEGFNDKYQEHKKLSTTAFNQLLSYSWPGNIRELENVIERLVITTEEELITEADLPPNILREKRELPLSSEAQTFDDMVEEFEKNVIQAAVKKYKTTVKVAEMLGMSQSTAARKMKKYMSGNENF